LANAEHECVILDEAHRARRRNLSPGKEYDPAEPNNLLRFLWDISPRTRSLLLATATPVQLHPIEAWDLMDALSKGSETVLGGYGSQWHRPRHALELVLRQAALPTDELDMWGWTRNPLQLASEGPDYSTLRRSLVMAETDVIAPGGSFDRLRPPDRTRVRRIFPRFIGEANPFHSAHRSADARVSRDDHRSGERRAVLEAGGGTSARRA